MSEPQTGYIAETERLRLRRLVVEDAAFILTLLNDPAFIRFIGDRGVRTIEDARGYLLNGPIASYARFGFGLFMVELKAEHVPIGICGLIKREALADVDVGYALLPEFRSRGYAREAAAAAIDQGRRDVGLTRVVAIVQPDNAGSIRVLEQLGLRFMRMIRLSEDAEELQLFARDLGGQP